MDDCAIRIVAKRSPGAGDRHDRGVAKASPARGASGRSLSRNAIVARLARFGGDAPLSLGNAQAARPPPDARSATPDPRVWTSGPLDPIKVRSRSRRQTRAAARKGEHRGRREHFRPAAEQVSGDTRLEEPPPFHQGKPAVFDSSDDAEVSLAPGAGCPRANGRRHEGEKTSARSLISARLRRSPVLRRANLV